MTKICSKCKKELTLDFFTERIHRGKKVIVARCRPCLNEIAKQNRIKNKERIRKYRYNYYIKNRELIILKSTQYKKDNLEYHRRQSREYKRKRRNSDIEFKLASYLRTRINDYVKNRAISAIKDLGCSVKELKQYLESKFQPGMSWDNYGRTGWHVDHIIPLSKVNLSNREELLKVSHYTNLQPLWASDNIRKGNKI